MIRILASFLLALPVWAATNSVAVYDTSGSTQTDRVIILPRFFKQGEISAFAQPVIGTTPATSWQCDRQNQWTDGSLRWAIISFKATIPAGGSVTVTFQNSTNPCSSGNQAACDAAGLDAAAMLNFAAGNWGGVIEATQNSTTYTTDARTMLTSGDFTYLLRGPVVTQVMAEDVTTARSYDFGWTCTANCADTLPNTDYATATWSNDATNRSLHPRFILTFPNGFAGVRVQPMIENIWSTLLQDQRYAIAIKDKSGNTEATVAEFTQWARTRRSMGLEFWDLATPGTIRLDLNLPYLVDSRVLPNYDTSITVNASALTSEKASSDSDACGWGQGCGYDFNSTVGDALGFGAMDEAAMFRRWEVLYFYSFSDDMLTVVERNSDASESIPIHYRESATGGYFVDYGEDGDASDDGVSAFGRVLSVDGRHEFMLTPSFVFTTGADKLTPVATLSKGYVWGPDTAHQPNFCVASYLATGDQYRLEEIQYWAAFDVSQGEAGTCAWCRHYDWGYLTEAPNHVRGMGWAARTMGYAGLLSPDPEKTYFEQKLKYSAAVQEGFLDIQDGNFYNHATHGAKWTWGRSTVAYGAANTLGIIVPPSKNSIVADWVDGTKTCDSQSHFMLHMKLTAEGWLRDVGYSWYGPLVERQARLLIEQTLDTTNSSAYLGTAYQLPITDYDGACGGAETYFSAVADMYDALLPAKQSGLQADFESDGSWTQINSGFDHMAKGAAAAIYPYSYSGRTGADVWSFYSANVPGQANYVNNPRWAILPQGVTGSGGPVVTTSALPDGTVGEAYSQSLAASGGTPPYTWSLSTGALCSGLTLSGSGIIGGFPETPEACSFTVEVTDANSGTDTQPLTITINPAPNRSRSAWVEEGSVGGGSIR